MTNTTWRYYLWNIGCQMNAADAARLAEGFEARGLERTTDPALAHVLLLNTCVVRQSAEDRVTGRLNSLKPLKSGDTPRLLMVMGCFVSEPEAMLRQYSFVDRFLRPSDVTGAMAATEAFLATQEHLADGLVPPTTPQGVTDMVPISYGCDHHCTYCIVTIRRGGQRSRAIADIVSDVRALVTRGAREITLLGQNVDAYGTDMAPIQDGDDTRQPDLADILHAIHNIPGLWRIRFLTSHPREMSQRIIDAVGELPKVCPSWELAIQSGDDQVLKRMARGYTADQVRDLVGRIRASTPDCAINTDIIVGFCGETDAQFENTMALLRELRFDMVHVANYSVRPGTPASRWDDDVPGDVKQARFKQVEALQEEVAAEINAANLGQTVEILVDGQQQGKWRGHDRNRWRGRTKNNKLVFFDVDPDDPRDWLGELVDVKITWTGAWSMIGEPVRCVSPDDPS